MGPRHDARHRVRGARHQRLRRRRHVASRRDVVLREARRGDERVDLAELQEAMLELGDAGRTIARPRRRRAGCATCSSTPARSPASAGRASRDRRRRSARVGARRRPTDTSRTSTSTSTSTRLPAPMRSRRADGLRVAGLGRLVDGGDGGDTYNYSPPDRDLVIDRPDAVRVSLLEAGPVRARVLIETDYSWPAYAPGDERACTHAQRRDGRRPRAHHARAARRRALSCASPHEIDNRARDHRLRGALPAARTRRAAPTPSARSRSCTAASPPKAARTSSRCRRSRRAGSSTRPTATPASRSCTTACSSTRSSHDGRELALTVLRAVGYLSRTEPQLRPNPAGPPMPLDRPQLLGGQRAEYAVLLHHGDWRAADCYGAADAFLVPFERTRAGGATGTPTRGPRPAPRCASTAPRCRP